ncbi:hypothetical protein EV641_110178 [Rhodococcus sp. SMB37]|nr:hypothetical protein EV641_110178 [Rhodococcus sp. SMB37]
MAEDEECTGARRHVHPHRSFSHTLSIRSMCGSCGSYRYFCSIVERAPVPVTRPSRIGEPRSLVKLGGRVRVRPDGTSVFTIVDVDGVSACESLGADVVLFVARLLRRDRHDTSRRCTAELLVDLGGVDTYREPQFHDRAWQDAFRPPRTTRGLHQGRRRQGRDRRGENSSQRHAPAQPAAPVPPTFSLPRHPRTA